MIIQFTNLKKYTLYNATAFTGLSLISSMEDKKISNQLIQKNVLGIYQVYGPIFNEKCIIGFQGYKLAV